jgi:hypothetical protein
MVMEPETDEDRLQTVLERGENEIAFRVKERIEPCPVVGVEDGMPARLEHAGDLQDHRFNAWQPWE